MGDAQPEAALDLEAPLPYSIVITALQGQKHPALSDAQPRCLAALLLPAPLFTAVLQQNKRLRSVHMQRVFCLNRVRMMDYHLRNRAVTFSFIKSNIAIVVLLLYGSEFSIYV